MSNISDKMSSILGFRVREGEWKNYLPDMDKEGEPTRKHIAEMMFAICEEVEDINKKIDIFIQKDLYVNDTKKRRNTKKSI